MVPKFVFKQKAREALKNNWQIALMVALIASLPSLISQVVAIMTQSSYAQTMNNLLATMQSGQTIGDVAAMLEEAGITAEGYMPTGIVGLITAIVSPFLTLGLLNYTFKLLRGEDDALIGTVLSRKNCFFKAIGLNIMVALRTILWMLPGLALEIVGMLLAFTLQENLVTIGMLVMNLGMIVMLVLGVRAAMHYAMATRVMAETPTLGVNACIRRSVEIMSHRKMLLFSLEISFILYHLGITLVESLLLSMAGNVLASTASMVLSFIVNVYMQMSVSAFYLVYSREQSI